MEKRVRIYSSFAEENEAEYSRRAKMTSEERMREFSVLQERVWGDKLREPMVKVATWGKVDW
jgi:hypothetical protein